MSTIPKNSAQVIKELEELAEKNSSGELLLKTREGNAKIYLNGGFVVWAFATGQDESFQSILIREKNISKDMLIKGIQRTKESGKKHLDDILIILGIASGRERNTIVERHTKAAFKSILTWEDCLTKFNPKPPFENKLNKGFTLSELTDFQRTFPEKSERLSLHTEDTSIPDILGKLRLEIPRFLAAMIIEEKTGMPVAALSEAEHFDSNTTSAFYQELIKAAREAGNSQLEEEARPPTEILITNHDSFVLLQALKSGAHFLYVMADADTNPGMVKVVAKRYAEPLEELLR